MRRLFWRIFAGFWFATVAMLIAFAWISTSNFETEKIPGLDITRLQAAMDDQLYRTSRRLRHDGVDAVRDWLAGGAGSGPLGIYVFTADGRELLGREPAADVRTAFAHADPSSRGGSQRIRTRVIEPRNGPRYVAVAKLQGNFLTRLVYHRPGTFWSNLGVAMLISAVLSLMLAWYVTSPLERVRTSARRFAQGDLDARVGRLRIGRSTEITALANEFDHMAERIKMLVESQRRLVRDVSHELRSPLARVRVALELARDGDGAGRQSALDRIELESDRLEAMLAQSLELSRLETAAHPAHDAIALDQLLDEVITNAAYEGAPHGRKVLLLECERITLAGWRDALYSAVENVIRNALAHTADGSTVGVRLFRDPGEAGRIVISVRDHGPGVAVGDLDRLFEPFFRTDGARTRSSGGTGLGLAIARRAVERHGGRIVASNAEGGGLLVEIMLPSTG
ncbi:MAG TPA: ATP-binding protein [Rhodanobacteraceae bacterium]|nr:ATP-binding protein [Rhodanobacteraceae bacterium]